MNKKAMSGKKRIILVVLGLLLLASLSFLFDANIFITADRPVDEESLEAGLERLLAVDGMEIWKRERTLLQKEAFALIEKECDAYRAQAASAERLENFTDEYFGYFKGFKFLYLGVRDWMGSDKTRIQEEINRMLSELIFFDISELQGNIQFGLENLTETHLQKYSEELIALLEQNFNESELEEVLSASRVNSISVVGSNIHSLVVTASLFGISRTAESIMSTVIGKKIVSVVVARIPVLSASTLTSVGTFGISILIDYVFSQGIKLANCQKLTHSLREAVVSVIEGYCNTTKKNFLVALTECSQLRISGKTCPIP